MIQCQIKEVSIKSDNFIYIPHPLFLKITCLYTLASSKKQLRFKSVISNIRPLNLWYHQVRLLLYTFLPKIAKYYKDHLQKQI